MKPHPPPPRPGISALPHYSRGRPATRPGGHSLASNEAPGPPSPAVQQAIARAATTVHRYPPGGRALIARLAMRLGVPAHTIAVAGGSLVLLQQLVAAYAGPGGEVMFGWRSYEAYPILAGIAGATTAGVPLTEERIDLRRLADRLSDRSRLILLANPNNPTGTAIRADELASFLDVLPDTCLLVLDEAYREFAGDTPDGLALARERPNVVMLRTFSKAYALAGMRVGYCVGHPEVIATLHRVALPFTLTGVAEAAALAALDDESSLHTRVRTVIAERIRVHAALGAMGFPVPVPQGNFVWLPLGRQAEPFADHCARAGISVRPFAGSGVRVTIGTQDDNDAFLAAAATWRPGSPAPEQPGEMS